MRRTGAWRGGERKYPFAHGLRMARPVIPKVRAKRAFKDEQPTRSPFESRFAATAGVTKLYASSSSGSKCGRNQICAISVGTTALPMTAVSRIVYCV